MVEKRMEKIMKRKTVRSFIAVALALQMAAAGATPVFAAQAAQAVPAARQAITAVVQEEEGDIALYLSDMKPTKTKVGFGSLGVDQDIDNKPLRLLDENLDIVEYEKGLCAHAASELVYDISAQGAKTFQAYIGVQADSVYDGIYGNCGFTVEVDGEQKYHIDDLSGQAAQVFVNIDIPEGAKTLTLKTDNGTDGVTTCDHSLWCDAKILCDREIQTTLASAAVTAQQSVLPVGKTTQLTPVGYSVGGAEIPADTLAVSYKSSDDSIATVSSSGIVTGIGDGIATITCTLTQGDVVREATVDIIIGKGDPASSWQIASPDGSITALFALHDGKVSYSSFKDNNLVVDNSAVGLTTSLGDFSELTFVDRVDEEINDPYELIGAKITQVENHANQTTLNFTKEGVEGVTFSIVTRAYDDGIAFKYQITAENEDTPITISSENTTLQIPQGSTAYVMPYINHNEQVEEEKQLSELDERYCMPLLYKTPTGEYALISEAGLHDEYCGADIIGNPNGRLDIVFSNEQKSAIQTKAPFATPWRFAVIGTTADIVENTMAENLSPANVLEDTSWIQPGVTAWTWLNRDPVNDPDVYKEYIDLAAEMGWQYLLLDEGWQPSGSSQGHSEFAYYGYYDWTEDLIDYANEKGIGLIAWQNHNDLKKGDEAERRIKELADMGIKGIKPDFFNSQSQDYIQFYNRLMRVTAENHMFINIHGANKTTGERRTYPNALSREGIFGAEQDLFRPADVSAYHNCMLPFMRCAVGPADYTPMFSHRTNTRKQFTIAQMGALTVTYESGIQCFADRPEAYLNSPARYFFEDFPGQWDETQLLAGEPGEYVNTARRSGENWYLGLICNEQRTAEFQLDFLGEGDYYAFIYEDGETVDDITARIEKVDKDTVLTIPMAEHGGAMIKILRNQPSQAESITLSASELTLEQNDSTVLTATLTPEDVEYDTVTWTSSNPEVATVENGKVLGLKPGVTTITAATGFDGNITASCEVTVRRPEFSLTNDWSIIRNDPENWKLTGVNSITITTKAGEFYSGTDNAENVFLTPVEGDFTATTKLTFVPGANYQTAGIIVYQDSKNLYGAYKRYHSGYNGNIFTDFAINKGSASEHTTPDLNKDAPVYLKVVKEGTTFTAYYSYDNSEWVQIADPLNVSSLTGDLKIGLYAVDGNGKSGSLPATFEDFTINNEVIPFANQYVEATEISLDHTELSMKQYETATLTATVTPEGADDPVVWTSSDPDVASVDENGKITAYQAGTVTITAMTGFNNEVTASCEVTISPADLVLTDDWDVLRNDPEHWQINSENSITIITQPGEFYTNTDNAKNVFLSPVEGDFTVSTKLDFVPTDDYQTAGIIVYQDSSNIYGAYKRYHSGFDGNIFTDFVLNNGKFSEHTTPDADPEASVYLKVVKEGTTFSSYYSYDNQNWTPIADPVDMTMGGKVRMDGDLKVGIYAVDGNGKTGSLPATFEDFTVNGNVGSFAEEPAVEESTSFMVNYGTNVELTLNGEEQTIANLIGRYTGDFEEGTELNLSFVPSVEGREFSEILLGGEPQKITNTKEFTYTAEKGATAETLDFSFTIVNKEILNSLIAYADTLDNEVAAAVPTVQAKFEKAYHEAVRVAKEVAVTQTDINDAWGGLLDAIHYLSFQPGDKSELEIQLEIAEAIVEASEGLDPSTIEELKDAMEEAQKVYDNPDAMEQEITEAVNALKEAIDNVRHQADKSILATVLAKAEAISNELDLYVEEGKEEFLTARKEAQEVYEDPQATQEEVDNASKTLTGAMTALRKIANKDYLKELMEIAQAKDADRFTVASYQNLVKVMQEAQVVLDDNTLAEGDPAAEAKIRNIETKLAAAIDHLDEKGSSSSGGSSSGSSSSSSNNDSTSTATTASNFTLDESTKSCSFRVGERFVFTVKTTSATAPTVTANNANVSVQYLTKTADGYSFQLNGAGMGDSTITVTLDGTSSTFTANILEGSVHSDTTGSISIKKGQVYTFKMTVTDGSTSTPLFVSGTDGVFKTQFVKKDGNDYYFRIWATGNVGSASGIYTTMPNQNAVRHCVATITA